MRRTTILHAALAALLMLLPVAPAHADGRAAASCPPTQAPNALGPSGTIGIPRPTFTWTGVPGATSYTLYVLRVSDEAIILRAVDITTTSYTPTSPLPTGTDLRWKVKGESPCGAGPYSQNLFFRVEGLSVRITSPAPGSTVSGQVNVTASASGSPTRVEFFVDGALQATDTTPPFGFAWNTATNPLPAANHQMDLSYYFVEYKNEATFAQCRAEVNPYTDVYQARLANYISDLSVEQKLALLDRSLANAVAERRRIHLAIEQGEPLDGILQVAARYWSRITRIEVADEPDLTRQQMEQWVATIDGRRAELGLARPPQGYGAVYLGHVPLADSANASNLDWIGIEAYVDPPGSPTSQANIDVLVNRVSQRKSEVPAGKRINLVMQAYDRNGAWPNIDTLRDLQTPVYLLAYNDPRVFAITMFSYTRLGGSRDHPELRTPHRLIAEKLFGAVPGAALGPRTLVAKAFDASGGTAQDRITVTVG